jgi:uncharacterized protein YgbK (DUF1537 family)
MEGRPAVRIACVVGTYRRETLDQLDFLRSKEIGVQRPRVKRPSEFDVFAFKLDSERHLLTPKFLRSLTRYDAIIASGSDTADFLLSRSGFICIMSVPCVLPMVGTGLVLGGLLQGKIVAIKPGHLGSQDVFLRIAESLRRLLLESGSRLATLIPKDFTR